LNLIREVIGSQCKISVIQMEIWVSLAAALRLIEWRRGQTWGDP